MKSSANIPPFSINIRFLWMFLLAKLYSSIAGIKEAQKKVQVQQKPVCHEHFSEIYGELKKEKKEEKATWSIAFVTNSEI